MDTTAKATKEPEKEEKRELERKDENIDLVKIRDGPKEGIVVDNVDEDLVTIHKIHSILLNCINLSKKDELEFCNSQRYFMKLYLKKMKEKLERE